MNVSRWLSLFIAIILILLFVISSITGGNEKTTTIGIAMSTVALAAWLLFPLMYIWYGDDLGEGMTGARYGLVSSPSPGWAVKLMGWILLVLTAGIFIWWNFVRQGK